MASYNATVSSSPANAPLWQKLMVTEPAVELLVARLLAAVVILPHGLQKVFGLFGGFGWTGTYGALTTTYGLPGPIAVAVMLTELLAPLALLLGLGGRLAAIALAFLMIGAATFHLEHGFFMNWFGLQQGEGFQFHVLFLAALTPLIVRGSGLYSLDAALLPNRR